MTEGSVDSASFRDPAGRVVVEDDRVVRLVSPVYREHYDAFFGSKVSRQLVEKGWLLGYRELEEVPAGSYRALESERLPFVSYPYEWSFSALKAAALLTLDVHLDLLRAGFVLKDATPYNVLFRGTRPVFIDLLSFEVLEEGRPWVAYRQFCEMFLAPLLLMAKVDIALGRMLETHLDGIPLPLCSKLLPLSTKLRPLTLLHVVLHARMERSTGSGSPARQESRGAKVRREALVSIASQLRSIVAKLEYRIPDSHWSSYYQDHLNYTEEGFSHKKEVVAEVIRSARPDTVWDLGSNTGVFSRIGAEGGAHVVSFDYDPACIERLYRDVDRDGPSTIQPLRLDLSNPSAGLGWQNLERRTLWDRGPADLVLALGLIHHLRFVHNVPFALQAEMFAQAAERLLVEFVPADDEMTRTISRGKEVLLADYTEEELVREYGRFFEVERTAQLPGSGRKLFLMTRR